MWKKVFRKYILKKQNSSCAMKSRFGFQVTYGMTVFLAQSVNLMVVSEMMPQGGVSVLGIFLLASLLMIG